MKKVFNKIKTQVLRASGGITKLSIAIEVNFIVIALILLCPIFAVAAVSTNVATDTFINSMQEETATPETQITEETKDHKALSDDPIDPSQEPTEEETEVSFEEQAEQHIKYTQEKYKINHDNEAKEVGFNIEWTNQEAASPTTITTPVYYGYMDNGVWKNITPFQTQTVKKDCVYNTSSRSSSIPSSWTQTYSIISHFDVRYYEETYTCEITEGGVQIQATMAYAGSYVTIGNTDYEMTKLLYDRRYSRWYYLDDLAAGSWTLIDVAGAQPTISIVFKRIDNTTVDYNVNWNSGSRTAIGSAQYLYQDASGNWQKINAPFAADVTLTSSSTSRVDANSFITANFAGRYVKQKIGDTESSFVFKQAYFYTNDISNLTAINGLSYNANNTASNRWYYLNTNNTWTRLSSYTGNTVNIIFEYDNSNNSVRTTLDTSQNIKITVFDYDTWYDATSSENYSRGINWNFTNNRTRNLLFNSRGRVSIGDDNDYNHWVNDESQYSPSRDHHYRWNHNKSHTLKNGTPWGQETIGSGEQAKTFDFGGGIFSLKLGEDGYPAVRYDPTGTNKVDESLAYLFDEDESSGFGYKHVYKNMTNLFSKPYYDETGYYYYGSGYSASYDADGKLIYEDDGAFAQIRKKPDSAANSNETLDNSFCVYNEPSSSSAKFMPFDDMNNPSESNSDFLFGMKIETNFIQPEDGWITTGGEAGPMIFNFNGDDDVIVYIDGVKVFDLGGSHRPCEGTINFNTGMVKYVAYSEEHKPQEYDDYAQFYIHDIFEAAGMLDAVNWEEYEPGKYRFADYETHEMKFFYLERGAGDSNCRIAFNLPTLPEGSILLGKDVDNKSSIAHLDGDFQYKVQVSEYDELEETYGPWHDYAPQPDPEDPEKPVEPLLVNVYPGTIYSWDPTKVLYTMEITEEDHGQISLQDGTVAVLTGFDVKDQFKIVEFDPRQTINPDPEEEDPSILDLLWKVFYNGVQVTEDDKIIIDYYQTPGSEPIQTWGYGTDNLYVGTNDGIQFTNQVSDNSLFDLVIQKNAADVGNVQDGYILPCFNGGTDDEGRPINTEPYVGDYWYVDENNNHLEDTARHADGITPIKFSDKESSELGGKPPDRILIEKVQMETRATTYFTDSLLDRKVLFSSTEYVPPDFEAGNMTKSYDGSSAGFYAARIPFVLTAASIPDADKYGQINFEVTQEPYSLKFEKQITGMYADKTKDFEMAPILYINSETVFTSDDIYQGFLYNNKTETSIDITAKVDSKGEIIINTDPKTHPDTYIYPILSHYDYIVLREILNKDNQITLINGFEEINTDFTPTFNQVTTGSLGNEMATPYSPLSATSGKEYLSMANPIALDTETGNYVYVRNHDNDSPETAMDLMKNPELWMLMLAVLLVVLSYVPMQLLVKYKKYRSKARRVKGAAEIFINGIKFDKERFEL